MSTAEPAGRVSYREAAGLFAALGDETRLRLVSRLCSGGPASVSGLAEAAPVSRQAITKHLGVLEQAGLVRSRRRGRERICELEAARLEDAHALLDGISRQWDRALDRLRAFVED